MKFSKLNFNLIFKKRGRNEKNSIRKWREKDEKSFIGLQTVLHSITQDRALTIKTFASTLKSCKSYKNNTKNIRENIRTRENLMSKIYDSKSDEFFGPTLR